MGGSPAYWPSLSDYQEAIQAPDQCFSAPDLRKGKPVTNKLGLPRPMCGNFASVYELESAGQRWAVKCFLRNIPDLHKRYERIADHIGRCGLPYFVTFEYLHDGMLVQGRRFPLVKMEWDTGTALNAFVEQNLSKSRVLEDLAARWIVLLKDLHGAEIAHGDLQHGNVLVGDDGSLVLIDYDGMWVPKLKGQKTHETGHPDYQSPHRTEDDFNAGTDGFAGKVIWVALKALARDPGLWQKHNNGDNLLFRRQDFQDPDTSALFADLRKLGEPEITRAVDDLVAECTGRKAKGTRGGSIPGSAGASGGGSGTGGVTGSRGTRGTGASGLLARMKDKVKRRKQEKTAAALAASRVAASAAGTKTGRGSRPAPAASPAATRTAPPKPAAPRPAAPKPAPARAAPQGPAWLSGGLGRSGGSAAAGKARKPAAPQRAAAPSVAPAPARGSSPAPRPPAKASRASSSSSAVAAPPRPRAASTGTSFPWARLLLHAIVLVPLACFAINELIAVQSGAEAGADWRIGLGDSSIRLVAFGAGTLAGLLAAATLLVGRRLHRAAGLLFFGTVAVVMLVSTVAELSQLGRFGLENDELVQGGLLAAMLVSSAAGILVERRHA